MTQSPGPTTPDLVDGRLITLLTTEHFTLQGARGITTTEALGRTTLYLGSISGGLVALSLLGNATRLGLPFVVAALVLTPTLIFLGFVTFMRTLESSMEDTFYARGINRLRHAYLELAPGWRPYFIQSDRDDMPGVMTNLGLMPGAHFQMYLNLAGMVSIINSVLLGSFVGGALSVLKVPLVFNAPLAATVFLLAVSAHMKYQQRAWSRFDRRYPSLFPSVP